LKQVFLAGEGRSELGGWAYQKPYRTLEPGVLETLLRRIVPQGWTIKDAMSWKDIVKVDAGDHRRPETRNVLGAALRAKERRCDVLVFSRDRDGGRDREHAIEAALGEISANQTIAAAGGVAIEEIESWVLSCCGHSRAESLRRAKEAAAHHLVGKTLVEHLRDVDPENVPEDALSLRRWIERVKKAFAE
jgi:hypothetical protein